MGIKNLLKFIATFFKPILLKQLYGSRVAVDGFVWMHKAVFSGLELGYNKNSTKYIQCFLKNVKILKKNGIIPIIVFDGGKIDIKNKEEEKRAYARELFLKKAESEKTKNYGKYLSMIISSISITFEMIKPVIEELKKENIEYIIAPYEADPQLAYLEKTRYVDYILTEDSDLCAYGVEKILFKFDSKKESCQLIETKYVMLRLGFDYNQFLEFCILSGCDFFKLKNIGLNKSLKLIKKYKNFLSIPIQKSIQAIKSFYIAKYLFLNARVFDPIKRVMIQINNENKLSLDMFQNNIYKFINENDEIKKSIIGDYKDGMTTYLISKGVINPNIKYFKEIIN